MATFRSSIKCLKSTCEIVFLLYLLVETLQLVHKISSFPEVLYKRRALKNVSKFIDKHKMQSSGSVLSKDILKNFAEFKETSFPETLF